MLVTYPIAGGVDLGLGGGALSSRNSTRDIAKVIEIMKDVGKVLLPAGISAETWWRISVGASITALIAFSLWATGLFGGGFALANNVDKVSRRQLETRLDDVHFVLCMEGADPQLLSLARALEEEYRQVNNGQPYVVNCALLLKLKR